MRIRRQGEHNEREITPPPFTRILKTNEELVLEVLNFLAAILHDVCATDNMRAYAEKWVLLGYDAANMKVVEEARLLRCGMPEGHASKVYRHFHSQAERSPADIPAISQAGSSAEGDELFFVDVVMEYNGRMLCGALLVDTGCDLDINISEYNADQLGLPYAGASTTALEMGRGQMGAVRRRGPVLTKLKLEGEPDEVLDDPMRSKYLEVWTDVGTAGSPRSTIPAVVNNTLPGGALVMTVSQMPSPIKRGKGSRGFDAILGGRSVAALLLGIDRETGRLYIKKRTSHRRV